MTTIDITSTAVCSPDPGDPLAEAHLAAAAFLARYEGRTLDAYRHDLRVFFQWALEVNLDVLVATRPQIELYVRALEGRGLAAATIDWRLSTVSGFYRFAHIDGFRVSTRNTTAMDRNNQELARLGQLLAGCFQLPVRVCSYEC